MRSFLLRSSRRIKVLPRDPRGLLDPLVLERALDQDLLDHRGLGIQVRDPLDPLDPGHLGLAPLDRGPLVPGDQLGPLTFLQ